MTLSKTSESMISDVKIIATDFDGVWTDGTVIVDEEGREAVICSRKDGLRIKEIKDSGIELWVISKERNPVVAERCKKIGAECYQSIDDKLSLLKKLLHEKNVRPDNVIFVGDDINDLECLKYVGIPMTVADGHEKCKKIAKYITKRNGGDHAMREIFDLILSIRTS